MQLHLFEWLWLFTALPGFALLRRARRAWLDHGVFASVSASYVASFVLITPVAVAGYAFGWPVLVLAYAMLGLFALAAVDLAWHWRELSSLPSPNLLGALVFMLVFVDYGAALNVGTHEVGDAHFHMAKVRLLMEAGLVDWDPYSPARQLDPVYFGNLYHALIGAWAKLSGLEAFDAWSRMLPWAKLVVAGSAEAFAFALFRSRPVALGAAAASVLAWFPLTMMPYPNQLAGLWLLPLALGSGIELLCGDRPWRAAFGVAGTAVALVQVHGLYFMFECIALGPVLLGALLWALARRHTRRSWRSLAPALGLLALCAGLPWFVTSALERGLDGYLAKLPDLLPTVVASAAQPDPKPGTAPEALPPDARALDWRYRGFRLLPRERLVFEFGEVNANNLRIQLLAGLLLAMVLARQRPRALVMLAMMVTVLLLLHVPALCTLAVRAAGSAWIVRRMDVLVAFAGQVIVPGALGLLLLQLRWLKGLTPLLAAGLALFYAYEFGVNAGPWSRERYVRNVARPENVQLDRRRQTRRSLLLRERVPPGSVVATGLQTSVELPQHCNCYALGLPAHEGLHGMGDMRKRRRATNAIFDPDVSTVSRAALLRRYGVKYVYVQATGSTKAMRRLFQPITVATYKTRGGMLLVVDGSIPLHNAP